MIIEIKTRAKNCEGPLQNLNIQPQYYIQCQLELLCTKSKYCILQSYHPENNTSTFFLIEIDHLLLAVIKDATDSILENRMIFDWNHRENSAFNALAKNVIGKHPISLRSYINKIVLTSIPLVKFI